MDSLNDNEFIGKCCKLNRDIYTNNNNEIPKNSNVIILEIEYNVLEYNVFKNCNRIKLLHEGKIFYFATRIKLNYWLEILNEK